MSRVAGAAGKAAGPIIGEKGGVHLQKTFRGSGKRRSRDKRITVSQRTKGDDYIISRGETSCWLSLLLGIEKNENTFYQRGDKRKVRPDKESGGKLALKVKSQVKRKESEEGKGNFGNALKGKRLELGSWERKKTTIGPGFDGRNRGGEISERTKKRKERKTKRGSIGDPESHLFTGDRSHGRVGRMLRT